MRVLGIILLIVTLAAAGYLAYLQIKKKKDSKKTAKQNAAVIKAEPIPAAPATADSTAAPKTPVSISVTLFANNPAGVQAGINKHTTSITAQEDIIGAYFPDDVVRRWYYDGVLCAEGTKTLSRKFGFEHEVRYVVAIGDVVAAASAQVKCGDTFIKN